MTVRGNATNNRQKHSHIFTFYKITTINDHTKNERSLYWVTGFQNKIECHHQNNYQVDDSKLGLYDLYKIC